MTLPNSNEQRFLFKTQGPAGLAVLRFTGSEGISELFQFQIDLVATKPPTGSSRPDAEVDFDAIVGKSAALTILGRDEDRYVQGIVSRFELVVVQKQHTIYRAWLVPPHAKLTLRRRIRIFQQKTTRDIVTQVLEEGGISGGNLQWKLSQSYKPRDYCVQYRESDWDFVSRLLEEEGIAYYFEHKPGQLRTIFTDKRSAFQPIAGQKRVIYQHDTSSVPDQEFVHALVYSKQIRTGKVELRDYSFKKPFKPSGSATGEESTLEHYDYPGEFVEDGLGKRLAQVRLEELETDKFVGMAGADCVRFVPGSTFDLGGAKPDERHPRSSLNREYLLVRVTHQGDQPQVEEGETGGAGHSYGNMINFMPSDAEFRPPRITPRPEAIGAHTAVVVGPKGEEIYTDKFGRVKVQFHWHREGKNDENSSCWIRVSQNWAGAGWGGMFLPRVGQEVLVTFLEGDPDRPVVTGRVYNGEQEIPDLRGGTYGDGRKDGAGSGLPSNKTRSMVRSSSSPGGKGFNELRFEDLAGEEQIYIHAQKDYDIEVEHNRTSLIKNDRIETVQNIQKVFVNKDRFLHVKNESTHTAKKILVEATQEITLKVGSSTIVMKPQSIAIKSPKIDAIASGLHVIKGGLVKIN